MLQCGVVCWGVMQRVAGACTMLQCLPMCCSVRNFRGVPLHSHVRCHVVLQCVAVCCSVLSILQGCTLCCSVLQCVIVCYSVLPFAILGPVFSRTCEVPCGAVCCSVL